jgi:hypothetical protein
MVAIMQRMTGRIAVLSLVGIAAALAPSASATSERSVPIRLGVGIGPINLGMTGQQVRRALGPPDAVAERKVIRGRSYVRLQWSYGTWTVGLLGRKGARRVVAVSTTLPRHKTPQGIGVGSSEREVARGIPGIRRRDCWRTRTHWLYPRGATETIFYPWAPPERIDIGQRRYEVGEVEVRTKPVLGCVTSR